MILREIIVISYAQQLTELLLKTVSISSDSVNEDMLPKDLPAYYKSNFNSFL